jgi:hypothetical protein
MIAVTKKYSCGFGLINTLVLVSSDYLLERLSLACSY